MTALGRVYAGRVDPPEWTHEAADALWCRLAAEGRVVGRVSDDGSWGSRTHAALVEHPALPPGEVYALIGTGAGTLTVYRCTPADAAEAVRDPSAFNL